LLVWRVLEEMQAPTYLGLTQAAPVTAPVMAGRTVRQGWTFLGRWDRKEWSRGCLRVGHFYRSFPES
jgi:hypothetical protein